MAQKNLKQTGTISLPVLTVIISTLCAVALILAFTFLFRTNSEIVHGANSNEAVSFNEDGKKAKTSEQEAESAKATEKADTAEKDAAAEELIVRAAPADAIKGDEFKAPSGNIACSFQDGVSCTIYEYAFKAPDECKDTPITFHVGESGSSANCAAQIVANTELGYGKAMKNSDYACTVSESGVDCWNEKTGDGFTIARETASYTKN